MGENTENQNFILINNAIAENILNKIMKLRLI